MSDVIVNGWDSNGEQIFTNSTMESTQANVKRMWVYITISQLLDEAEREEKKQVEMLRKAYELALANSFSTYVTSVVVPKPDNSLTVVNPETRRRGKFMLYAVARSYLNMEPTNKYWVVLK